MDQEAQSPELHDVIRFRGEQITGVTATFRGERV